ncbi:hypothetical protein H8R18_06410 [Nanchangia anserum]|uniref:Uncharacterized protein n=1 Tax=Nanchangia anserum TaxID=2692125 RepID=A0A8I0GFN4_9ACTO|nr:hypothetical protein [Nanchangia anserum]MBD3689164.1 hypothetical protein [Nanchangia anserum]QOX81396.1 hypothetical protein H8R18_06410 [Nanchangia anserum]
MPTRVSPVRRLVNAVIGLILLAVLIALCFQIYRVATGQTAVYGRAESVSDKVEEQIRPQAAPHADTAEVRSILATQPVAATELGGDAHRVTFRSPSGQLVCTIADDVSALDATGWVPRPANASGQEATGAGAVCVGIANLAVHRGDAHACAAGQSLRSSVVGVWNDSRGIGACSTDATRMFADARDHAEGGDRFQIPELGFGMHVELGDYGCTMTGSQAVCAQLSTGRGFSLEDNVDYGFFPN